MSRALAESTIQSPMDRTATADEIAEVVRFLADNAGLRGARITGRSTPRPPPRQRAMPLPPAPPSRHLGRSKAEAPAATERLAAGAMGAASGGGGLADGIWGVPAWMIVGLGAVVVVSVVAYLVGDAPGHIVPESDHEKLVDATQKAGLAFEVLILRKKIVT